MITDVANQVANAYAPTTNGSTLHFQSYIDRLAAQEDGAGMDVNVYGVITTTVTNATTTGRFQVLGNPSDPTFATGNVVLLDTGVLLLATMAAGYQFFRSKLPRIPLLGSPELTASFLRYLTVSVLIGTADWTAGAFSAWIGAGTLQDDIAYPAGYSFP